MKLGTFAAILGAGMSSFALAQPVTITSPTTIGPTDTTIGGVPLATALITVQGTTLAINGRHQVGSLTLIRDNAEPAVLTHTAGFTYDYGNGDVVEGFDLTVTGNMLVQSELGIISRVDTNGYGHLPGAGPGAGAPSASGSWGAAGGGHGGYGATTYVYLGGTGYGSITQPVTFGSGGGEYFGNFGGAGGGSVKLTIGGVLTIDGAMSADGTTGSGPAGGGAGGSIWINAGTLAGSGSITASSPDSPGAWGGGGGGRIALYYNSRSFNGSIAATGGSSAYSDNKRGGAGTVYFKLNSQPRGSLRIENISSDSPAITDIPGGIGLHDVDIHNSARARSLGSQYWYGNVNLSGSARLQLTGLTNISANFTLAENDSCVVSAATSQPITIGFGEVLTVGSGSSIDVTGQGYDYDSGPGAGNASNAGFTGGAGGGYGGNGADSQAIGGVGYGSVSMPEALGSGGGQYFGTPGGSGGGAVRLQGLTLRVNGSVIADGLPGGSNAGCGSGGSVLVQVLTIDGSASGLISAKGGTNGTWGGGGGGRIALHYRNSTFLGTTSARGGHCAYPTNMYAGAGTIFTYSYEDAQPKLTVDNETNGSSAVTLLSENTQASHLTVLNGSNVYLNFPLTTTQNVDVLGGSQLTLSGNHNISGSFTIDNAGSVVTHFPQSPLRLTVQNSLLIGVGASIDVSSRGFDGGNGPGTGSPSGSGSSGAAGGGHGGKGGSSFSYQGGQAYGDLYAPVTMGSGGGEYFSYIGGNGGGAVELRVANVTHLQGSIRAEGKTGDGPAGGGAGGSIYLTTGSLLGSGEISARGASTVGNWGPGGGGRIAIYGDSSGFAGIINSQGGWGSYSTNDRGGAGTRVVASAFGVPADITIENDIAGNPANTPIADDLNCNSLTIASASYVTMLSEQHIDTNLTLTPSARLEYQDDLTIGGHLSVAGTARVEPGYETLAAINAEQLTIEFGGTIDATGRGLSSAQGPGAGTNSQHGGYGGAGAGYGGRGADSGPFAGGAVYGDPSQPIELGSGGGEYFGYIAGNGGGHIRLNVTNAMVVDGTIISDGNMGNAPAGGGSGGSVYITTGSLSGGGSISAAGGPASGATWGAGGGGRVAIYTCNRTIPDTNISASAGYTASTPAFAGTVYYGGGSIEFTEQPVGGEVYSGGFFQLGAVASGNEVLTYQWRRRNINTGIFENLTEGQEGIFSGVNDSTLFISGAGCGGGGDFDCLACDSCGCVPSQVATVLVNSTGDYNFDGGVDGTDVDVFFADWVLGDPRADVNADGGVDGADVDYFFVQWSLGC